jgi:uncharacterized protein
MNETQIADYLSAHPEFFERHAELLAAIRLKSPHGAGVISLQERQTARLREQNRRLERRIAVLLRYGQENDAMADTLVQWTARLLAQRDPYLAPRTLLAGLRALFDVSHVALRLWDTVDNAALADFTSSVHPNLRQCADQLSGPVCGKAADMEALQWFKEADAEEGAGRKTASGMGSAALIALRRFTHDAYTDAAAAPAFGLIMVGSSDPARFDAEMATDFLARIGALSSAALAHLHKTAASDASRPVERASP